MFFFSFLWYSNLVCKTANIAARVQFDLFPNVRIVNGILNSVNWNWMPYDRSVDSGTSALLLIYAMIVLLALLNLYRQLINNKMDFFFFFSLLLVEFGVSTVECRTNIFWSCCHYCQLTPQNVIFFSTQLYKTNDLAKFTIISFCDRYFSFSVNNKERVKTILYNKYVEKLFTFIKLIF